MEVHRQSDERGGTAEERWREIFDKVFAGLRSDHPADEWTLRIVDQLAEKAKPVAENAETPLELLETGATEEVAKHEAVAAQEAAHESVQQAGHTSSEISEAIADGDSAIASEDVNDAIGQSSAEDLVQAVQSVQEETPIKEPLTSQPTEEPVAADGELSAQQPHDGQVECEVAELECQSEHAQHLHDAPGNDVAQAALDQGHGDANEVPLTTLDDPTNEEVVDASADQAPNQQEALIDGAKETQQETIDQEPAGPEARSKSIQRETLQADSGQEDAAQQEDFVAGSAETKNEEALEPDVGAFQMVHLQTDDLEPVAKQSADVPAVVNEAPVEPLENRSADQVGQEQGAEIFQESQESQAIRMYAETHFISMVPDLPRTDMDMEPAMVEVTLGNREAYISEALANGDAYDDPEKQIDELEVKPVQVEQESVAPQAEASGGKAEQVSQTPPRPSSPPAKRGHHEEHSRKPEWLRRPLVRKGSVGRFLGRMKETMQSKRFHPDRLPAVPPPLPEPPKRPPRRKTLHNLDLTRESLNNTNSAEQSHVESAPPVQTTPPPPPAPQSTASTETTDNRSATLRSNASERRRKNSVGRFFGKVLSAKHANQSESGTAPEEAPLLQQEDAQVEAVQQQQQAANPSGTPATPARSVSPTPAPSEKSKRLPHASLTDVSQYFRRILRPKTPAHDEVKSDKHAPERPPPPHPQADDITDSTGTDNHADEIKPVVRQARVHFRCQKCQHQWLSAKGLAWFEIVANQVGEGICHGEVLVRLYGQQCNRCPVGTDAAVFESADWSAKEVERALTDLLAEVSRRHYPGYPRRPKADERGRRAHQRLLCQACQEGVCQIKAPC